MDSKIINKTKDSLGKYVKKPPLTDKLLGKPPFRFLHDVMSSVIKNTGFMKGLYTDAEMNSENVKDKDSKVAFLQKSIDMVSLVLGKTLAVKPSKVVAGHEPERTNEFLQQLAEAIGKKVNNDDYVQRVLKGDPDAGSSSSKKKDGREKSSDRRSKKQVTADTDPALTIPDQSEELTTEPPRNPTETASKPVENSSKPASKKLTSKQSSSKQPKQAEVAPKSSAKASLKPPAVSGRVKSRLSGKETKGKPRDKGEEKSSEKEKRHKSKDRDREDRKERDRSKDREREERKAKERKERDEEKDEKKEKHRDRDSDKHRERRRGAQTPFKGSSRKQKKEGEEEGRDPEPVAKESRRKEKERDEEKQEEPATNGEREDEPPQQPVRPPRPTSAKGSRRHRQGHGRRQQDSDDEGEEEQRAPRKESGMNGTLGEEDLPPQVQAARKMARPSSARPAPPRVKKNEGMQEEAAMLGQSNVPNIITDKNDDSEDEDDGFVAKEDEVQEPQAAPQPTRSRADEEEGDHGGLVKKMLKTKEELEGGSQTQHAKKTEIERSSQVSDATKRKEREMVQREIDKLRGSIQTLTRSVNPLGKIMDFVQEDLDSMQKELAMWQKENGENAVALQREQSITEGSVEPLKAKLKEIDSAIGDQLDLIAALKSNILKNDDRIEKMLGSVTKS